MRIHAYLQMRVFPQLLFRQRYGFCLKSLFNMGSMLKRHKVDSRKKLPLNPKQMRFSLPAEFGSTGAGADRRGTSSRGCAQKSVALMKMKNPAEPGFFAGSEWSVTDT